ncbi:hypothetical protein [Nonomuraea angiospora]|uniref:hypothetical protein n=1 Tax=Nonomuraea angiospora TaxID=46172 RepID=UPI0029B4272A|nr:hypothetical protein [Nonomuraea angiospora]MDX3109717.1 hypothetical protein [Nonomuraea angiospora]
MTYAPLWPGWDTATREVITQLNAEFDDETRDAVRDLATFIGSHLRAEFVDVDPQIVGWVTMRVASHLGAMAAKRPDVDPRTLATVALLAGEYIEAGDV